MTFLIAGLFGGAAALLLLSVTELAAQRTRGVRQELRRLERRRATETVAGAPVPARPMQRLVELAQRLGGSLFRRRGITEEAARLLVQAGYRGRDAQAVYWGVRALLAPALALAAITIAVAGGGRPGLAFLAAVWGAALGWVLPPYLLRRRVQARQREIERALPDALDLLVVCVEAGLGVNQALARMSEEIRNFSPVTAGEFSLVNLEIRAGVRREDAVRNLGERTGVAELRTLATMLIQAERFGTSMGQTLRTQAEVLRDTRRARAEEAAAKTSIKLIFPVVLCIFPTLFVVVLGPALLQVIRVLGGM